MRVQLKGIAREHFNLSTAVFFQKMVVKYIDTTTKLYATAKSDCEGTGGFLVTILKDAEQKYVTDMLTAGLEYWDGASANDGRPGNTLYCWTSDPDYTASLCTSPGYMAFVQATGGVEGTCPRVSPFGCMSLGVDFDSLAANAANVFCPRFVWNGANWYCPDRLVTGATLYRGICSELQSYGVAYVYANNLNRTFTRTDGQTLSWSADRSITLGTKSRSESISFPESPTPSSTDAARTQTWSATDSLSRSAPRSASMSPSPTARTRTALRTQSESPTVHESPSATRTKQSTDSLTRVSSPSRSADPSRASASPSRSGTDTDSRPSTRSLSPRGEPTTSYTNSLPDTRSRSRSKTVKIVVPPVIADIAGSIATATMALSVATGAGVVAAQQARLKAANSLALCGAGIDLDDEPDRISSPFKMTVGTSTIRYYRGMLLGNFILVCLCLIGFFIVGGFLGWVFIGSWMKGALRFRWPSLVMIPLMILQPPTATAAAVMFFFPHNGRDVIASMAGGTLFLMIPIAFAYDIAQRIRHGDAVLEAVPEHERAASRATWRPRIGGLYECMRYVFGHERSWRDRSVWEHEANLRSGMKRKVQGAKRAFRRFEKHFENEHERYPFCGRWGEFFDEVSLPFYFLLDFAVSTLQGLASGAAAGPQSRFVCYVCLTGTMVACLFQFIVVCWKRPGLSRIFQTYLVFATFVQFVAFFIALLRFIGTEFAYQDLSTVLSLVQGSVGLVMGLVNLVELIDFILNLTAVNTFCRKKKKKTSRSKNDLKENKRGAQDSSSSDGTSSDEEESAPDCAAVDAVETRVSAAKAAGSRAPAGGLIEMEEFGTILSPPEKEGEIMSMRELSNVLLRGSRRGAERAAAFAKSAAPPRADDDVWLGVPAAAPIDAQPSEVPRLFGAASVAERAMPAQLDSAQPGPGRAAGGASDFIGEGDPVVALTLSAGDAASGGSVRSPERGDKAAYSSSTEAPAASPDTHEAAQSARPVIDDELARDVSPAIPIDIVPVIPIDIPPVIPVSAVQRMNPLHNSTGQLPSQDDDFAIL